MKISNDFKVVLAYLSIFDEELYLGKSRQIQNLIASKTLFGDKESFPTLRKEFSQNFPDSHY